MRERLLIAGYQEQRTEYQKGEGRSDTAHDSIPRRIVDRGAKVAVIKHKERFG